MDVLEEVTRTLNEVLSHGADPKTFTLQTPLLELDGSIFANVGSLVAFVSARLPQ